MKISEGKISWREIKALEFEHIAEAFRNRNSRLLPAIEAFVRPRATRKLIAVIDASIVNAAAMHITENAMLKNQG